MPRPSLLTALALLLLVLPTGCRKTTEKPELHSAIKPECRRGGCLKRFNEMNKRLAKGNVDLLFIGDSITAGWLTQGKDTWKKYYAHRNAVNLGRSGERTQHLLWQLDNLNVDHIQPKLAVVLIGTNNVTRNTPEEAIDGVTRVVQRLRQRLPETTILLLGVFPRGPNNDAPDRKAVEQINQAISQLHDGKSVIYKDLRDLFLNPDGTPTKLLRSDTVHITPAGYEAWAEAIEPIVSQCVGPLSAKGSEPGPPSPKMCALAAS